VTTRTWKTGLEREAERDERLGRIEEQLDLLLAIINAKVPDYAPIKVDPWDEDEWDDDFEPETEEVTA